MKGLVVVPTYNESANIVRLVEEILRQGLDADVLVVDDNSPDGTSRLVEDLARSRPRVRLMERKGARGRGLAGIEAFREASRMPVDYVLEMDADFSHDPAYLPRLVEALKGADVAIASRLVAGGGEPGRSPLRRCVTRLSCGWVRFLLGIPVADITSGFRGFRRSALAKIDWDRMISVGPSIVEEVLWAVHRTGAKIVEIPLQFAPRSAGKSQLTLRKLFNVFWTVTSLRFRAVPLR